MTVQIVTVREEAGRRRCSISQVRRERAQPMARLLAARSVRQLSRRAAEAKLSEVKGSQFLHHPYHVDHYLAHALCAKLKIEYSVLEPD